MPHLSTLGRGSPASVGRPCVDRDGSQGARVAGRGSGFPTHAQARAAAHRACPSRARPARAKTAVADGRWARVGSTNLNIASWLGNYELDVVAEDRLFAGLMETMYLEDLAKSTEVVLDSRHRVKAPRSEGLSRTGGSASRAATGLLRVGNTIGAAIADHRVLEPVESRIVFVAALLLLTVAAVAVVVPRALAYAVAAVATWLAGALVYHRCRSAAARRRRQAPGRGDLDEPA